MMTDGKLCLQVSPLIIKDQYSNNIPPRLREIVTWHIET